MAILIQTETNKTMKMEIINEQPRDSEYESGYKKGVSDTITDYRERRRKELAESQAKDTRIKELVEYVRDYRNLLDEYQSNYELVIKLDEFLKPYTP